MTVAPSLAWVHMAESCLTWSFLTGPMAVRAGSMGPIQARLIKGSQLREGQGLAHMGSGSQGRGGRPLMGRVQTQVPWSWQVCELCFIFSNSKTKFI